MPDRKRRDTNKQLTGYAKALQENKHYPLKPRPSWKDRRQDKERRIATPYLVVPNVPGDHGIRPLDAAHAHYSGAIEILDAITQAVVTTPVAGHTYILRCHVNNFGAVGCYAGIAEFYVATPAVLDALVSGGPRPAPLGYGGVMVPAGGEAVATCQRLWTVDGSNTSVLVRIYDPIVDKPQHPYDSATDRHVARRDAIPDFSGTYIGMESANQIHQTPTKIKIVIQQVGNLATVSVYSQVGGGIPSTPQDTGTAVVTGNSFVFNYTEYIGLNPFTSNVWTFSLPNPNTLHFSHYRHYLQPGDGRPDTNTSGDLPRQ